MSNCVYIVRTIFQTVEPSGAVASETYGIRVYDDYGSAYSNFLDNREELLALSPDDLFELARETDRYIIDPALQAGATIWVDDDVYIDGASEADDESESPDD